MHSAPNCPAAALPPGSAAPSPPGCAAPAVAHSSSPAHTHTATPSTSTPVRIALHPLRCRPPRTPSVPSALLFGARKNLGDLRPTRPLRWAATGRLGRGCTPEIVSYLLLP